VNVWISWLLLTLLLLSLLLKKLGQVQIAIVLLLLLLLLLLIHHHHHSAGSQRRHRHLPLQIGGLQNNAVHKDPGLVGMQLLGGGRGGMVTLLIETTGIVRSPFHQLQTRLIHEMSETQHIAEVPIERDGRVVLVIAATVGNQVVAIQSGRHVGLAMIRVTVVSHCPYTWGMGPGCLAAGRIVLGIRRHKRIVGHDKIQNVRVEPVRFRQAFQHGKEMGKGRQDNHHAVAAIRLGVLFFFLLQ